MMRRFQAPLLFLLVGAYAHAAVLTAQPILLPEFGATNVPPDTLIEIHADHALHIGSGTLTVSNLDGKIVDFLDLGITIRTNTVGGKSLRYIPVISETNTLLIQLHSGVLSPGSTYTVSLDPQAILFDDGKSALPARTNSWSFTVRPNLPKGKRTYTVGPGPDCDFATVQGAVDAFPNAADTHPVIVVKKGVSHGLIVIPSGKNHLTIRGEERQESVLEGFNNNTLNPSSSLRAVCDVEADDFRMENLTLRNSTPYKGSQAEALRIQADRALLLGCDFSSFQDTLQLSGSVYVKDCLVSGDVDFIWGEGTAFFQDCELRALHDGYYLQSRSDDGGGFVFLNCRLTAAPGVSNNVLARIECDRFPYSAAAYLNCAMGPHVPKVGWNIQGGSTNSLRYGESGTTDLAGKPLDLVGRNPIARIFTPEEVVELSDPKKVFSKASFWDPAKAALSIKTSP
jgi:hypothetical protein